MQKLSPVPLTSRLADETFNTGAFAVCVAYLSLISLLHITDVLSLIELIGWIVVGLPVVLLVSACALGVWVGYSESALYKSGKYHIAREEYRSENEAD